MINLSKLNIFTNNLKEGQVGLNFTNEIEAAHFSEKVKEKLAIRQRKINGELLSTWLHDKREVVEGPSTRRQNRSTLDCTTPNCHSALSKASLHDLRNNTKGKNCCI